VFPFVYFYHVSFTLCAALALCQHADKRIELNIASYYHLFITINLITPMYPYARRHKRFVNVCTGSWAENQSYPW